jgi:NAD(P)H-hydrate epimerase
MTVAVDAPIGVAATTIPTLSAAEMAEVDRRAIDDYGIGLAQMMEQAGSHLAEVTRLELGGSLLGRALVIAVGPGHIGGGGLVAARHLVNRGAHVRVVLARPALRSTQASRRQLATLLTMRTRCCVATYDVTDDELSEALRASDVVVDAIVGYGLAGPPRDEVQRLIDHVVRSGRPVISLDLPSGLDPDTGSVPGSAVAATATMTVALPKRGLFASDGPAHAGRVYLADIGIPASLYGELGIVVGPLFAEGRILLVDGTR